MNNNLNKVLLITFLFSLSTLNADFFDERDFLINNQLTLEDSIPKNMPLIKKVFWDKDGLFRKWNIAPESRYNELELRRNMMQWHQKIALVNLALMSYQYYLGKEIDQDRAPLVLGIDKYNDYKDRHKTLGYTTYTIYMTSAGLSIFSPPALKYDKNLSPMKLHRYLALVHFTGMFVQPWLGYQIANGGDSDYYENLHRKTGEIVFSSYLISFLLTLLS